MTSSSGGHGDTAPPIRKVKDYADRWVRLTAERWRHVLRHPEMPGQERKLRRTLREPDVVCASRLDASVHLYYRLYSRSPVGRKYLMVAVKILDRDAYVITAFFTGQVGGGTKIWAKPRSGSTKKETSSK